jgi:hypothetical protein
MEPQWLYYSEVADILSISEDDVKQLIKDERLVSVGNGRARRVTRHSLKLYRALYEHLPPPAPSLITGYVYLIRYGEYHKIGIAKNVRERIVQMQVGLPEVVTIVHTIPTNNMIRAETMLHERYAAYRVRGEWFRLSEDHLDFICSRRAMMFDE